LLSPFIAKSEHDKIGFRHLLSVMQQSDRFDGLLHDYDGARATHAAEDKSVVCLSSA
jgi:hypothetical protein